jgi:predicted phosphodiesterase
MSGFLDLGRLDAPVLVFGGPYGNLQATRAMITAADRMGIPAGRTICTGDVAAYCAEPQGVVDLLQARGIAVVMGNCEESLAAGADDCGCGFAPGTTCDSLAERWYAHSAAALDAATKRWMGGLPRMIVFTTGGRRLAVVHGAPSRINRFVFASTPAADKMAEMAVAEAVAGALDGVVAGHSGLPFAELVGGQLWLNAGAVGLPANDGTPRVWYAVLRPLADGLAVEIDALAYDPAAAARAMRAAGLPEGYATCLETGLWPSLDVLPPAERAATGRPLAEATLLWPDGRLAA